MEAEGWKLLKCNKGDEKFLIKLSCGNDNSYNLMICDLVNIWKESLSGNDIKIRCKQLNRRLEAPTESILIHIEETLLHHTSDVFTSVKTTDEILTINLKNSFQGGIPFHWEFTCEMLPVNDSIKQFVGPLLKLTASLQSSNDQLIKVINKKDAEIRDYKESGAKVTRPYLETVEFNAETFHKEFRQSSDYGSAITKDNFTISTDRSINVLLIEVEEDCKCPPLVEGTSNSSAASKVISPTEGATVKIVGHSRNRVIRGGRKQPRGVEVLSDSESDQEIKVIPAKKALNQSQKKSLKKKKVVDKRKKLF